MREFIEALPRSGALGDCSRAEILLRTALASDEELRDPFFREWVLRYAVPERVPEGLE